MKELTTNEEANINLWDEYEINNIRCVAAKQAPSALLFLDLRCRLYRNGMEKRQTNADRIRSMSDEELVKFIEECCQQHAPVGNEERYMRRMVILEWLLESYT